MTICYVGFIYATLPVMRPILNFLKENLGEAFSPAVYVLLFFVGLGIIILFFKEGMGASRSALRHIRDNRRHPTHDQISGRTGTFLEYAVLGIMLYFALRGRIQGIKVLIYTRYCLSRRPW